MKEGLLFLSTLLVVTYLCWLIFKAGRSKTEKRVALGIFAYKDDAES